VERNLTYGRAMRYGNGRVRATKPVFGDQQSVPLDKLFNTPQEYEVTCAWCKEGQGHYKPVRSHTLCKKCENGLFERDGAA
jgi:hypothetical protein